MVLSNTKIVDSIQKKHFDIIGLAGLDPREKPFNTSAVDLRLGSEIVIPKGDGPFTLDLRKPGIAGLWAKYSKKYTIDEDQPYILKRNHFVLANTQEKVDFSLSSSGPCYSARVEGKSSLARCGILVHFTAPTIHAGFRGSITLEMINLGPVDFSLYPGMFICQLIIEEVAGVPEQAPNQFNNQVNVVGEVAV